jgi:hypothetical protein
MPALGNSKSPAAAASEGAGVEGIDTLARAIAPANPVKSTMKSAPRLVCHRVDAPNRSRGCTSHVFFRALP